MAAHILALLSGSLFGSALTASSMYLPSVILGQLSLTSTLMLKTFMTASACSALIIYMSNKFGYARLPYRSNSAYGWFGNYDANVIGGLLQGLGMAMTGACPGTMLVQLALQIQPAGWILGGALLGGLAFVVFGENLKGQKSLNTPQNHTVMGTMKISNESAVLGYEILLTAAIGLIDALGLSAQTETYWTNAVKGGLLIGCAQASSVLLSRKTLGVSSAYSEIAGHLTTILRGKGFNGSFTNVVFAAGVMLGALLTSQRIPVVEATPSGVGVAAAIIGGFASIFGARLAGGCTSGHGISGMSTLSISSFVTVGCMFGGGIAFRLILNALSF